MEIRTLRYFLAVAREENMTRAAEQLHVTQPTLSKALRSLEDELGKKLFSSKSGLKLSPSIRLSLIFFTIRYSIHFPSGFRMVRSSALPGRITSFAFSFL